MNQKGPSFTKSYNVLHITVDSEIKLDLSCTPLLAAYPSASHLNSLFPHLCNGHNNRAYVIGFLEGLDEKIQVWLPSAISFLKKLFIIFIF